MAASVEVLTAQMVKMSEQIAALQSDLQFFRARVHDSGKGGGKGEFIEPLLDLKKMFPQTFVKEEQWRDFSEEFLDYIGEKDKSGVIVDALKESATAVGEVRLPDDEDDAARMRTLFILMKRIVKEPDARMIPRNTADYNSMELWRQLVQRFDPQNETTDMRLHNMILNPKPIKDLCELIVRIARWEKLQRDYITKSGDEAINEATEKLAFIDMLPPALREYIKKESSWKTPQERTYRKIKEVVQRYTADQVMTRDPDAMECDAVDYGDDWEGLGPKPAEKQVSWEDSLDGVPDTYSEDKDEEVDSLGQYARQGKGAGKKGKQGKNNKGKDGGKQNWAATQPPVKRAWNDKLQKQYDENKCFICDKVGCRSGTCPDRPKKPPAKGKGKKGGGKKGVSAVDEEWADEDLEEVQALGFACMEDVGSLDIDGVDEDASADVTAGGAIN